MSPSSSSLYYNPNLFTTATNHTFPGVRLNLLVDNNFVQNSYGKKFFSRGRIFQSKKAAIKYENKVCSQESSRRIRPAHLVSQYFLICKTVYTNYNSKQKQQQKRKAQKMKVGLKL